jgi:hypothetical protein
MPYRPSWRSLRNHALPQWFQDAKFGIYTHWGVYSVPACGPNGTWYPYNMYRPGTPQHEHHDGFSMWDSSANAWNASKMGPMRDVVGEPHDVDKALDDIPRDWTQLERPSKAFIDRRWAKTKEVIDGYRPDLMWFDFGIPHVQEHYKREFLAYYYDHAERWGKEVVVTYKHHDLAPGSGVVDLELGRFNDMTHMEWITDTTVDNGQGWCYLRNNTYKDSAEVIHYLIDNVSKNGYFTEDEKLAYTPADFRFTANDDTLYVICLAWPEREASIATPWAKFYPEEVARVTMLGADGELRWWFDHDEQAMKIETPAKKPCDHAFVFRIERKRPFEGEVA